MADATRVFVLGAGMSVDAGVPAMNDLTKLVLSEKYMLGGANQLAHFCALAFPNLKIEMDMDGCVTAVPGFFLNVEEFMSALDALQTYSDVTGTWKGLLNSPERLSPLFLHLVARAISDTTPIEVPEYYRHFASSLTPSDWVITLNWDCLTEMACDAVGVRWAYPKLQMVNGELQGIVDPGAVPIVKLHGSVNWRSMKEGLDYDHVLHSIDGEPNVVQSESPLMEERQKLVVSGGTGGLTLHGAPFGAGPVSVQVAEAPFIIPPSHFKSFPQDGLPGLLWTCAAKALRQATEVTVIGYSLPLTDYVPRWLLRMGLLFNSETGRRLVMEYMGCPLDADADTIDAYGLSDHIHSERHVNELRFQGMLHGSQRIRECWDRACIPIHLVNPDAKSLAHFRQHASVNVDHHTATASEFFDGTP